MSTSVNLFFAVRPRLGKYKVGQWGFRCDDMIYWFEGRRIRFRREESSWQCAKTDSILHTVRAISHHRFRSKLNSIVTALLSTSRGNLFLKLSIDPEYHQILTETRFNIGNPPGSGSTESKADQSSESIWNHESPRKNMSSLSISMMLFPAINMRSCSIPHKRSWSSRLILRLSSSNLSHLQGSGELQGHEFCSYIAIPVLRFYCARWPDWLQEDQI